MVAGVVMEGKFKFVNQEYHFKIKLTTEFLLRRLHVEVPKLLACS